MSYESFDILSLSLSGYCFGMSDYETQTKPRVKSCFQTDDGDDAHRVLHFIDEEKDREERVRAVLIRDVRDFIRDFASGAARVFVAYKVMIIVVAADGTTAFSTALLVVGYRIFGPQTNWMHRTRRAAWRKIR